MSSNNTVLSTKNFVVFEGLDGCGTTTQSSRFASIFSKAKLPYLITAEPTKMPVGMLIRQVLSGEIHAEPETLAYLFAADRNEHLYGQNGILEACTKGQLVLCDRYVLSSLAYQGSVCKNNLPARLNADFPPPELTVFFRIRPEKAMQRVAGRSHLEIFEKLAFQERIARMYDDALRQAIDAGWQIVEIDAEQNIDSVTDQIVKALRGIGLEL